MQVSHFVLFGVLVLSCAACEVGTGGNPGPEDENNNQVGSTFSVALIGDMPYGKPNEAKFENLVADINAHDVAFVLHSGDIKAGSELCSDELIKHRFDEYQAFNMPFVYTPGDNEWTDCHRQNNGPFDPLERLDLVRKTFFPDPNFTTGGKKMPVHSESTESQFSKFVENVWFKKQDVVFATFNVPGSNNNLKPWTGKKDDVSQFGEVAGSGVLSAAHQNEYTERNLADLAWLDTVFDEAENAKGVVLLMQANPDFETFKPADNNPDPEATPTPDTSGYQNFLVKLLERSKKYGKPVLVAHGDNHVLIIDNPFDEESPDRFDPPAMNVTRVQNYGDSNVYWVEIVVDPNSEDVFTLVPHVLKENE